MFKRVAIRALRGAIASCIALLAAKYGNNVLYGPIVTTLLLAVDKAVRENNAPAK